VTRIEFDRSFQFLAAMDAAIATATEKSAVELVEKLKAKLQGPRHGRTYTVSGKPSPHTASAPGEAPAHWEGILAGAIKHLPLPGGGQEIFVDDDEAAYAGKFLEFGSPGGKIAARPWFRPTADAHEAEYVATIEAAAAAALGILGRG